MFDEALKLRYREPEVRRVPTDAQPSPPNQLDTLLAIHEVSRRVENQPEENDAEDEFNDAPHNPLWYGATLLVKYIIAGPSLQPRAPLPAGQGLRRRDPDAESGKLVPSQPM